MIDCSPMTSTIPAQTTVVSADSAHRPADPHSYHHSATQRRSIPHCTRATTEAFHVTSVRLQISSTIDHQACSVVLLYIDPPLKGI